MAHFVEHLLFKGTPRRPNPKILIETIEGVGGMIDAYTNVESTVYSVKVAHIHLERAIDVLADMLQHPNMSVVDVDKERRVIRAMATDRARDKRAALEATPNGQRLMQLVVELAEMPLDQWPAAIGACAWLQSADRDFRADALTILRVAYDQVATAQGIRELDDPLPPETTPFFEIRDLLRAGPAAPGTTTPRGKKPMITITMNLNSSADIQEAAQILAGLFGRSAASPTAPALIDEPAKPARARTTKTEPVAQAAPEPEPQTEAPKAEPAKAEPAEAPGPDLVLASLQAYAKMRGPLALRTLLTDFGATKFGDLKPDQYPAVLEKVAA
jgi:hypothetical protein